MGLTDLLPEREAILIADETENVVSALTSIADSDRRAIAHRARAIVLADHTGTARARKLLRDVAEATAPGPSAERCEARTEYYHVHRPKSNPY